MIKIAYFTQSINRYIEGIFNLENDFHMHHFIGVSLTLKQTRQTLGYPLYKSGHGHTMIVSDLPQVTQRQGERRGKERWKTSQDEHVQGSLFPRGPYSQNSSNLSIDGQWSQGQKVGFLQTWFIKSNSLVKQICIQMCKCIISQNLYFLATPAAIRSSQPGIESAPQQQLSPLQ